MTDHQSRCGHDRFWGVTLVVVALFAGCGSKSQKTPPHDPRDSNLGETITMLGTAYDSKIGALVETEQGVVWLDGISNWPNAVHGKKVSVTGKLAKRQDLPVFVEQEGALPRQGMPIPAGTDVAKASTRYLLEEPIWELVGNAPAAPAVRVPGT